MGKKIIVCADGTWNDPEQRDRGSVVPTNVVKIARALALANVADQEDIYYDLGVGTGNWKDRLLGGLIGNGLMFNIFQCFYFIAERYQPGDKIYLFGFSRGAYTVRSLAGLICNFGIDKALTNRDLVKPSAEKPAITTVENKPSEKSDVKADQSKEKLKEVESAYKKTKEEKNNSAAIAYRETHDCFQPEIEMIGVWDTVGSLGIPMIIPKWIMPKKLAKTLTNWLLGNYRFLNVDLNPKVRSAYHALSIDENRRSFKPTLWNEKNLETHQKVKQIWFAGIHSNVGGGYADSGLSDNALLWMLEQAEKHGLSFCKKYMTRNIQPDAFYGEIRNERQKLFRKLIFKEGLREIELICNNAAVKPLIAQSAIDRQKSKICKTPYTVRLPEHFELETGF